MLIDLHTHSSESDGSLSPKELVSAAKHEGLAAIALCDHDTTSGLAAFLRAGEFTGVECIPGVEISATWPEGNCHIVGLGYNGRNAQLENALQKIRESRGDRNVVIIRKLEDLGIHITMEDVAGIAGGDVIGRPHMARIMVQKGFVASVQEAFDRFLAKGAPAYVDRFHLPPGSAVELLKRAGCIPVLAHPVQLRLNADELEDLVLKLIPCGLAAIEAYCPYDGAHDLYIALAKKYSLAATGGSDFHGASKPDHKLGYYETDRQIPYSCLESFHEVVKKRKTQ
jgi:predicted metal-dependent phosphoesterase TrpH